MKIKELVASSNEVRFTKYFDGQLWYEVIGLDNFDGARRAMFEFPVPVSDIGNATFLAKDRAILFMRYIRKHLDAIEDGKKQNG